MPEPGLAPIASTRPSEPAPVPRGRITAGQALLACGIVAPLLYGAMNVFIPLWWSDYDAAAQTISELSAIGAPTRPLWVGLGIVYTLLGAAFGWGVWMSARGNRSLRVAGAALAFQGIFGLFWPPMHQRGEPFMLTDALHIVWAMATLVLMLVAMSFGAAALGGRFRLYTIATVAVWLVFGTLTAVVAPNIAANLPTPLIGVWERINAGVYMLWLMVLALMLLRRPSPAQATRS